MGNVKTVTISSETAVKFDAFYPFVWIKNTGDTIAYAAAFSGIVAGAENVVAVPAGESVMITAETDTVYILSTGTTAEVHGQGYAESPFLDNYSEGSGASITVESLSVTENGVYTAPSGKAYSPVTVDVVEQPWEPLEDGYSNFWFELTNDTLSPWLKFSAKNADATIDWGDGSGEVALDTLTPTHTYSRAGKYIVKVKGVTGIAYQQNSPGNRPSVDLYAYCLKAIELTSEIASIAQYGFNYFVGLEHIKIAKTTTLEREAFLRCTSLFDAEICGNLPISLFNFCVSLRNVTLDNQITSVADSAFYQCGMLNKITLPSTITEINSNAFRYCYSLSEIHCQATTPPTLGTYAFANTDVNVIIYVPAGYSETYKAAAGWSAYSDHILEEGQTPNRAMMSRLAKADGDIMEAEKNEADDESSDKR